MKGIVVVATHKDYWMPKEDCYLPVQVGRKKAKKHLAFAGDDTGVEISSKNGGYCELTGLYWAWKNLTGDYLGLVHYRRHFSLYSGYRQKQIGRKRSILTEVQLNGLLERYQIILPKKRRYYIESVYEHYIHTHYREPLDKTREMIARFYPEYLDAFDQVMKCRSACMFNMFIMKWQDADRYCSWIFEILERLENQIDTSHYSPFQARVYGRISELLLNVWVMKEKLQAVYLPVAYLESPMFFRKAYKLLKSKVLHQYY